MRRIQVGGESASGLPATLYSPELNPQEHVWDELRKKFFHNRAFESLYALEAHLEAALCQMESSQAGMQSIAGLGWIISRL